MVLDGLRGYLQLASGLTEVTRARAQAAARALLAQGEAGVGAVVPDPVRTQVGALADDLVATSRANRSLLVGLVRSEVERSVARLGLVSAAELDVARQRAASLERRVGELERELARASTTASSGKRASAKQASSKRASAKQASSKQASSKQASSKQASSKQASSKQPSAERPGTRNASGARKTTGTRKSTAAGPGTSS